MLQVFRFVSVCPVVMLFAELFVFLNLHYLFLQFVFNVLFVLNDELILQAIVGTQILFDPVLHTHQLHKLIIRHAYRVLRNLAPAKAINDHRCRPCCNLRWLNRGLIVTEVLVLANVFKLCLKVLQIFILAHFNLVE